MKTDFDSRSKCGFPRQAARSHRQLLALAALAAGAVAAAASPAAHAATLYWAPHTASSWSPTSNWSTQSPSYTPPAAAPGASDVATFNIAGLSIGNQTINTGSSALSVGGLVFNSNSTASTTFLGSGTAASIFLGASGIAVNAGAGATTISAGGGTFLSASQTWTNNSSNTLNDGSTLGLQGNTLTLSGTGNFVLGGPTTLSVYSGGITMAGSGTASLGAGVNYTGATSVNSGTLQLLVSTAVSYNAALLVASGGTLDLNGLSITTNGTPIFQFTGTGVGGNGALINSNTTLAASLPSSVTINNSSATIGGAGNITLSSPFIGTNAITKISNNTLVLGGTANNAGTSLMVNAGTVILAKISSSSVHAVTTGISIAGGTVQLSGTGGDQIADTASVTVTSGALDTNGTSETINTLSLQGTGISGAGALVNNSSSTPTSLTANGGIVLTSNASIGVTNSGVTTYISSTISGNFALTKVGAGLLGLTGTNTFTGGLTISAGSVLALSAGALNSTAPNTVTFGPNANASFQIAQNTTIGGLTSDPNPGTPTVQANAAPSTTVILTVNNSANNTYAGTLVDGAGGLGYLGLLKSGTGTLTLAGANTNTGGLEISAGTLRLGNASAAGNGTVSIDPTGTLDLGGQATPSINAIGVNGSGATLTNSGPEASAVSSPINIGIPNGALNVTGTADISVAYVIAPLNGSLTKSGANNLTLDGTFNNINLSVTVNAGNLYLNKSNSAIAVSGNLAIAGGLVQIAASGNQLAPGTTVGITSGVLDLNGNSATTGLLNLQGTGLAGAGALLNSAAGQSTISPAAVNLTGNTTIGVSQTTGTLIIASPINSGGYALTKVGPGALAISGGVSGPVTINAGTFSASGPYADVVNYGTFNYTGGAFSGRLTNAGVVTFSADFAPANGMENDSVLSIPANFNMTLNGLGLDNEGTLTLSGGNLVLSTGGTAANLNHGNFNLSSSAPFGLGGATLSNTGTFNLNGSSVTGTSAALINGPTGIVAGPGTILSPFSSSGLVAVGSGTTNISQAWTNSGEAQLASVTANLTGGAITNNGTIDGLGTVSSAITNNGTIEATSGILRLSGTLTNTSLSGTLRSDAGAKILVLGSFATNAGIISLTGGTFDTNGQFLNNTGQITGYGTLATGGTGLSNAGTFTLTGGVSTVNGNVTNLSAHTINVKYNPAIFTGAVTNNAGATIKTTSTTATFASTFSNAGTFTSDPATNIFQSNTFNGATGSMTGGAGDVFDLTSGSFNNAGAFINGGTLQSAISISNSGTFTQTGPQIWNNGTTFSNTAGTATFATDPGTTATRNLSIAITGGTVNLSGPQHLQGLSLTGGKLDINGDTFLAAGNYSALAAAIGSNAIFTDSTVPGATVALLTGENFLLVNPAGLRHGQTILPTDLVLTVAYGGDTNLDGVVNEDDYLAIDRAYAEHLTNTTWINGDSFLNGTINAADYAAIDTSYRLQSGTLADGEIALHASEFGQAYTDAFAALNRTPVPEPASLLLLASAVPLLMVRRHRRRTARAQR